MVCAVPLLMVQHSLTSHHALEITAWMFSSAWTPSISAELLKAAGTAALLPAAS